MIFFKSFYYRIIKSKTIKFSVLVVGGFLIAGCVVVYLTAGSLITVQQRAEFLRENPIITKFLPVYWEIRKLSDFTDYPWGQHDQIPNYRLEIATDDLVKLKESLPEGFMGVLLTAREYVPARFYAGSEVYDVEVRYRGDNAIHWNASKKSYLVRFKKKESFQGLTEISFIIPDDRFFALEHFNNWRAVKLGLKTPVSGFANLDVDGQGNALYFAIESWSREMLDKWQTGDDSILYGNTRSAPWGKSEDWQLLVDDPKLSEEENFVPLDKLIRLLNQTGDEEFNRAIFNLVDKDNFYAWQIHQELVNSTHQIDDNLRMYFDPTLGKFFFVPWDVESEDLSLRDNFGKYGALAARIFKNPEFLREKNARVKAYVSDEKNLEDDLAYYDQSYESFKVSLYRDRMKIYTNRFADRTHVERRAQIAEIFHKLGRELNFDPGVRIEDDFNLAYPAGKSDELVTYLKGRYIDDQSFLTGLGPEFSSAYGDEDFTDTYFDTPQLELYNRQAGLRYRVRKNRQDGGEIKELVQFKLSGSDKFADMSNAVSRNELKFQDLDDPELASAVRKLGLDPNALRPILTLKQHRRRVYLNRNGNTFISFSIDEVGSALWWSKASFSQMEIELNEVAYTAGDKTARAGMQKLREGMISDMRGRFAYLQDDKSIKYTKTFDLLKEHLPGMRFLIRVGILRD